MSTSARDLDHLGPEQHRPRPRAQSAGGLAPVPGLALAMQRSAGNAAVARAARGGTSGPVEVQRVPSFLKKLFGQGKGSEAKEAQPQTPRSDPAYLSGTEWGWSPDLAAQASTGVYRSGEDERQAMSLWARRTGDRELDAWCASYNGLLGRSQAAVKRGGAEGTAEQARIDRLMSNLRHRYGDVRSGYSAAIVTWKAARQAAGAPPIQGATPPTSIYDDVDLEEDSHRYGLTPVAGGGGGAAEQTYFA